MTTVTDKDLRLVAAAAERSGWTVERTQKGHLRFLSPTGEVVITGTTNSDWRAMKNLRRDLERVGLDLDEEPKRSRPSARLSTPSLPKYEMAERDSPDHSLIGGHVYRCLADGPLTQGLLVVALRRAGVKVVSADLRAPLRGLVQRGVIEHVGATYVRPRTRRKRRAPATGTTKDVVCALRKGVWHCTQHNNRPTGEYRSLCGYAMPVTEKFEERRPSCPHCLEKLTLVTFL